MWFSNQVLGTSRAASGEGMEGAGLSRLEDLADDSSFSFFFDEQMSFLLGAIVVCLKKFRKRNLVLKRKGQEMFLKWASGKDGANGG